METSVKDKAKNKLNEWKTLAKHLKVQMHLGKQEAREAFEEQKKQIAAWADKALKELKESKEISAEKISELKHEFELLRTYGMLAQAETEQELKEQQEKISHTLDNIKSKTDQAFATTSGHVSNWKQSIDQKLQYFKMTFDLFRLQLHLGTEEAKDKWEQAKQKASSSIDKISKDLNEATEQGEAKFDALANELEHSWDNVKAVFSK